MRLVIPDGNYKMVRYGEWWRRKRWHFLAKNADGNYSTQRTICGAVCLEPEYASLSEINPRDLCAVCWPFGITK